MTEETAKAYRRVWRLVSQNPRLDALDIARRLQLQRGVVYDALHYLRQLGYIAPTRERRVAFKVVVPFVVMP